MHYTLHTQYTIYVYPVKSIYCIVHIDYTNSQLYFDTILHSIYRMCVKINVLHVQCTVYTVHIAYIVGYKAKVHNCKNIVLR